MKNRMQSLQITFVNNQLKLYTIFNNHVYGETIALAIVNNHKQPIVASSFNN